MAAAASTIAAPLALADLRFLEIPLRDHRREALIVGVDLTRSGRASHFNVPTSSSDRAGRRTLPAVEAHAADRRRSAWRRSRGRRRGSPGGPCRRSPLRSSTASGLASVPDGSVAASPMRRLPRSTPRTRAHAGGSAARGVARGRGEERERVVDRRDLRTAALHDLGVLGGAAAERLGRVARESAADTPRVDEILA